MYVVLAISMIACNTKEQAKITSRYLSQDYTLIDSRDSNRVDSIMYYVKEGYKTVEYAKNSPYTLIFKDSVYKMEPTWAQAFEEGKHDGSLFIFIIGIVIFIGGMIFCIDRFQQGTRDSNDKSVLGWIIIPFIGFIIAAGAFSWDKWNNEKEITKQLYYQSQDN